MRELEIEHDSDSPEDITDSDDYDDEHINSLFINSKLINNTHLDKNEYILHLAATRENNPNIAAALSNNTCEVCKLADNQVANILTLDDFKDKITNCKFSNADSNLLYTGSTDGAIKLWDLRMPMKSCITYQDTTVENGNVKTFSCFDVSSNDKLLVAGTDLFQTEPFLLFWDSRNVKFLGGYWEVHTDDITQVKFHPEDMNKLISGSVDGLINVYDLTQSTEENALLDSLNTESSIEQLLWYNEKNKDCISCITHTSDLQLWTLDGVEHYKRITRKDIANAIKKKREDHVYMAQCHNSQNGLLALVGSNYNNGECLRGLQIRNGLVQPLCGFIGNEQIIRSSWYDDNYNILFTGGEKGIMSVWKLQS